MSSSRRGVLVVISGPSGVGKSSIIEGVADLTNALFSVSATTRAPRRGETEGVDYRFVDRERFLDAISRGIVLEWAEYGGNLYGTLREPVVAALEAGTNVILDIENEGAKQIRRTFPDAVLIFIAPPDLAELAKRLKGRGDTHQRDIERRLSIAELQIAEAPEVYDNIVVNRGLDAAIAQVLGILTAPGASTPGLSAV